MKGGWPEGINGKGKGKDSEGGRGLKYPTCVCAKAA
jgi:hypothetical protein